MVTAIFFEESAAYERVRTIVEQHGGQIEKISMFSGDAIFAVFGASQAQEDHPERAVRAALAVRDELGVRAGVATGEVVVRPEGAGPAVGDALNTAARLLSTARRARSPSATRPGYARAVPSVTESPGGAT